MFKNVSVTRTRTDLKSVRDKDCANSPSPPHSFRHLATLPANSSAPTATARTNRRPLTGVREEGGGGGRKSERESMVSLATIPSLPLPGWLRVVGSGWTGSVLCMPQTWPGLFISYLYVSYEHKQQRGNPRVQWIWFMFWKAWLWSQQVSFSSDPDTPNFRQARSALKNSNENHHRKINKKDNTFWRFSYSISR